MILNVSSRTDVPAFYTDWFMNRYHAGFVDVRNPFNPKLVSRISFDNVDAVFFCTKNPIPIIDRLSEIDKPMIFHVTITGYRKDIEPNLPPKKEIIEAVKKLSGIIGKENIVVRYDPVFLSDVYTPEYHARAFEKLCALLEGYVPKILISFLDEYKNVKKNKNILKFRDFTEDDYRFIGESFSKSAESHGMTVFTCFEDRNLTEYGFADDECLSHELAKRLTGKEYKEEWKARKERKCHCVAMADVGAYNTCRHLCRYCYANFDEKRIEKNSAMHNPGSTLLIGEILTDDVIKQRIK